MKKPSLSSYLDFITETAYAAGRLTLAYFNTGIVPDYKADLSPVTIADRKAETLIRARIEKSFPDHAIQGEELGESGTKRNPFRWYIDPIDGTKSFVRGVPLYGVLIGLEIEGEVEVGAAYFPALDEMLAAASGLGCWWNGRRARVSQQTCLDQAVITTTSPHSFIKYHCFEVYQRLAEKCYYQTGWGDAYGYALVATGRAELMLDPVMHVWDCAPFPPIFREAGGYFGDWTGSASIYSGQALATTPVLLPEVLEIISRNNP